MTGAYQVGNGDVLVGFALGTDDIQDARSTLHLLYCLAERLNLIGVGGVPGLPEGQTAQTLLDQLAATSQRLSMHLRRTRHTVLLLK